MPTGLEIPTQIDLVEFISKQAHDLKSPFNRSLGFLKLVIKGMDGPIPDQARDDLSIAYQNNQQALALVSALIEVARLTRGERRPTLVEYDLTGLLEGTLREWKKVNPQERPVEVSFTAPAGTLFVDEGLFRRCLVNWIAYTSLFAPLESRVAITAAEEPGGCAFTVQSSGKKGQPPPDCDLTLYGYVARQILELHQGTLVSVEENEAGAQVKFIFPR